ncbi:MAG: 5'-nucleotidase C-terminal domain-containing protein [Cyanobacteria bacterium SZAS LIN-5]|nr:5'-nucleotidase C-terminal domain-containing protein [Cyanobacteria bacterium SZAS LIN-5]
MAPPQTSDSVSQTTAKPTDQDASAKLFEATHKLLGTPAQAAPQEKQNSLGHIVSDVAGTLTSGVAGAVTYSLLSHTSYGRFVALAGSAAAGSLTNYGVKAGLQEILCDKSERDTSWKDLAWGAANGLSGSIGAIAETGASKAYAERVGLKALGQVEDAAKLREAGFRMFESDLSYKYKASIMRGIVGGGAGTFAYSLPHSVSNHWGEIQKGDASAVTGILKDVAIETTVGGLTGGVLSGAFTTIANRADVIGYARAKFMPSEVEPTRLNIGHVNDVHSSLVNDKGGHPWARMATEADRISAEAEKKGITTHFVNAGDEFGGTEIDASTHNGLVENMTLEKAMHPTARTMGNHAVDKAASITEWLRNAKLLQNETGEANTVVSNVAFDKAELAKYSKVFSDANLDPALLQGDIVGTGPNSIVKPYLVRTITGPNGPERVGYIGLVTEEIDPMGLQVNPGMSRETTTLTERYIDSARKAIETLKADPANADVQKVILVSHLGRGQDVQLAKEVEGLSAIIGAHSHDAQPVPHWVKANNGWNVPVVQAGNDMKWLGQLELAFKPNSGEVDKYMSSGRLIPLTEKVAEKPAIVEFLQEQPFYARVTGLRGAEGYGNVSTAGEFSVESVRAKQTTLGTLVSDGLHAGINDHLASNGSDVRLNAFLKHSGDIRKTIPGDTDLSGWHFANLFCNGENSSELTVATMNGEAIRRALEFGVQDMPAPEAAGSGALGRIKSFAGNLFKAASEERPDYSGNFVQTSGMRYQIDLTQPPIKAENGQLASAGSRIKNIEIWKPGTGEQPGTWQKLDGNESYQIGTLFHPIDKWAKSGIYDDMLGITPDLTGDALKHARVNGLHSMFGTEAGVNTPKFVDESGVVKRGLGLSQPRLMVDYLSGKAKLETGMLSHQIQLGADGAPIADPANLGRIDGRIVDITPQPKGASWTAIGAMSLTDWRNESFGATTGLNYADLRDKQRNNTNLQTAYNDAGH